MFRTHATLSSHLFLLFFSVFPCLRKNISQAIIKKDRVTCHIKVFTVLMRTTLEFFSKVLNLQDILSFKIRFKINYAVLNFRFSVLLRMQQKNFVH